MVHVERITPITSSLSNYSDAYILLKGTIIVIRRPATADVATKQLEKRNKGVIFKNCTLFTDCINETSNIQVDNAKDTEMTILQN